ncbi:nucleoid occlusion protein [Sedimentibacter sp. zth1]|uniref:nucleoid occlusion protein n=1 Tax=Sedimentibacter sp. zth1 TaxID=2816908 RepID=UPI001A9135C3|nr:nucleoid occlusion protein [Sedimentibacter sp. zth1]QSX05188.1 nucleoid occlusion protein [Sedimentibacter sp. zth1]
MSDNNVKNISVSQIIPNKNQPRKNFDKKALEELSLSIKNYGLIQPIVVRKLADELYELIAGERRFKASKLINLEEIPAIVISVGEEESAAMALIENLQRENLNFLEEAIAFEKIINDFNITQQVLAEKIGKTQSTVANKMRLLKLPTKVKEVLIDNNLSERHARALLKINDENLMIDVLDKVIKKDLNVSETEKLIQSLVNDINKEKLKNKLYIKNFINYKIYINTIKNAYKEIVKTGIDAKFEEVESENFIELKVKIPKKSI